METGHTKALTSFPVRTAITELPEFHSVFAVSIVEFCLSSSILHVRIAGDDVAFSDEHCDIKFDRTDYKSLRKIKVYLLV